jgi:Protein of unknown function (DUF4019)
MRFRLVPPLLPVAAALLAAPLPAQQVDTAAAVAAAQSAGLSWLSLVDHGDIDASWDSASTTLRAAVSRTGWATALHRARDPLEPFGSRALTLARFTTELPGAPAGRYVILQYQTEVSQDRQVIETVVPAVDSDGHWRVSGYFVRPKP